MAKPQVNTEDLEKEVEVDLSKQKEPEKNEPKYASLEELEKIRKQLNSFHYAARKIDEVSQKLEKLGKPAPTAPHEKNYDDLVEKDWQGTIREMAKEEAERILKAERDRAAREQAEQKRVSVLEQSKQKVRERYPDIDDESSEIAQRFIKIRNEHPEYLYNEYGPVLAMRDMEDELKSEGRLDEFTKKVVDKEVQRIVRTSATSTPKSTAAQPSGKVTLTKEEKELCDFNGIRYEDYARQKQALSKSRGGE